MNTKKKLPADAIFCPSFGKRKEELGLSNKFLIEKILNFYKNNPLPLIIQKDCADYFPREIKVEKIINQHRVPRKYLDTREVVRQCVKYCQYKGYKKILVFAHPDHLARVIKNINTYDINYEIVDTQECPYDPKSTQLWTKNKSLFLIREKLVNFYMLFRKQRG